MGAKVVLVGFDGADRTEIARMADGGQLPVLARMRAEGLWGRLDAFDGLGDDAAWSSFATGVGPGNHGRRFYRYYRAGTYDYEPFTRNRIRAAPFWDALSAHGLRVAVLDVPKAPIGTDPENLVIADWMSHGAHVPPVLCGPDSAWRVRLADWLDRDDTNWNCHTAGSPSEFVVEPRRPRGASAPISRSTSWTAREWDALVVVFAETHCAGHFLWDEFERVEAVYRAVDAQLGRIVDAAGTDGHGDRVLTAGHGAEQPDGRARRRGARRVRRLSRRRRRRSSVWSNRCACVSHGRSACVCRARVRRVSDRCACERVRHSALLEGPDRSARTRRSVSMWSGVSPSERSSAAPTSLRCAPSSGANSSRCAIPRAVVRSSATSSSRRMRIRETLRKTLPTCTWSGIARSRSSPQPHPGSARCTSNPVARRPGEHRDGGWFAATGPRRPASCRRCRHPVLDLAPTVARLLDAPFSGEGVAIPGRRTTDR